MLEAKDQFDAHDIRAILLNLHAFLLILIFLPVEWGKFSGRDVLSHPFVINTSETLASYLKPRPNVELFRR